MQIGNPQNIYAFQAEFTAIFKQLPSQAYPHLGYRVLPEAKETNVNGRHRQRLDILLRDGGQPPPMGLSFSSGLFEPYV